MGYYQISYCVEVDGEEKFRGDAIMFSGNKEHDLSVFREMVISGYGVTFPDAVQVTVTITGMTDIKDLSLVKSLARLPIIAN